MITGRSTNINTLYNTPGPGYLEEANDFETHKRKQSRWPWARLFVLFINSYASNILNSRFVTAPLLSRFRKASS